MSIADAPKEVRGQIRSTSREQEQELEKIDRSCACLLLLLLVLPKLHSSLRVGRMNLPSH
jgi:hypothetical protein